MLEKILLAAAATFSLNVLLGIYIPSQPQTTLELNRRQPTQAQPARLLQNNYSLKFSLTSYRTEN